MFDNAPEFENVRARRKVLVRTYITNARWIFSYVSSARIMYLRSHIKTIRSRRVFMVTTPALYMHIRAARYSNAKGHLKNILLYEFISLYALPGAYVYLCNDTFFFAFLFEGGNVRKSCDFATRCFFYYYRT